MPHPPAQHHNATKPPNCSPNSRLHSAAFAPALLFTPAASNPKKPLPFQRRHARPALIAHTPFTDRSPATFLPPATTPPQPAGVLHSTCDAEGPGAPGFDILPARSGSPSRTPSYRSPLLILRAGSQTANSFTDQPTATAVPFVPVPFFNRRLNPTTVPTFYTA
jgi:hypothetical protein